MQNQKIKTVVSLFDGISVARLALERLGVKNLQYFASEIDEYAMAISAKNYPDIVQLGSVTELCRYEDMYQWSDVDLLIGGSPCQDLSVANKGRKGLDGSRSSLFWEYVRILKELKPKYFILENVASMSEESKNIITEALGVEPVMIDAALVSAQERKRLFWTNISVPQPKDFGIIIKDILERDAVHKILKPKSVVKTKRGVKWDTSGKGYFSQQDRAYSINGKHPTVPTARTNTKTNVLFDDGQIVALTWREIERLQSFPDGYTDLGDGNRVEKRGGVIGNAFNAKVIEHIIKQIV